MPLYEKAASIGLDLSSRQRPAIALLPRGNWLRYTWYDFPTLLGGGVDRVVEYGLQRFAQAMGRATLAVDRLRGLETIDRWLGERLAHEPDHEGALRVVYIEQQTGPFSRKVGKLVARHLGAVEPALADAHGHRYRVELSPVQHSQIARRCLPDLLAASEVEFDWSR